MRPALSPDAGPRELDVVAANGGLVTIRLIAITLGTMGFAAAQ